MGPRAAHRRASARPSREGPHPARSRAGTPTLLPERGARCLRPNLTSARGQCSAPARRTQHPGSNSNFANAVLAAAESADSRRWLGLCSRIEKPHPRKQRNHLRVSAESAADSDGFGSGPPLPRCVPPSPAVSWPHARPSLCLACLPHRRRRLLDSATIPPATGPATATRPTPPCRTLPEDSTAPDSAADSASDAGNDGSQDAVSDAVQDTASDTGIPTDAATDAIPVEVGPDGSCPGISAAPDVDPWLMRSTSSGFGGIETASSGGHQDVFLRSPGNHPNRPPARLGRYGGLLRAERRPRSNVIDANDTGRELQIALYDPTRAMQPCAYNASCQTRRRPATTRSRSSAGTRCRAATSATGGAGALPRGSGTRSRWSSSRCNGTPTGTKQTAADPVRRRGRPCR